MKTAIILSICFLTMGTNDSCLIEGKGFKGYVFDKEHFVLLSIENQAERYTPSKEDVFLVEKLISSNLEKINFPLVNQGGDCPVIHKSLRKYVRQYVGFINKNGEKIIWVNFIWNDKTMKDKASKDIVSILDGCSHFWKINVNLTKEELFDLKINGSS